jgi:hypothetical protein
VYIFISNQIKNYVVNCQILSMRAIVEAEVTRQCNFYPPERDSNPGLLHIKSCP